MIETPMVASDPKLLLQQLRLATHDSHIRLEATAISKRLMAPGVTVHDYALYLAYMQQVVRWFTANVHPQLAGIVPNMESRSLLAAIEADIADLSEVTDVPAVREYDDMIPDNDIALSLGMLYVMEGSSLGGQMILRHLRAVPELATLNAFRYFTGYGADTGTMWRSFLEVLTGYAIENNCMPAIIAGSVHTFNTIEDHFAAAV